LSVLSVSRGPFLSVMLPTAQVSGRGGAVAAGDSMATGDELGPVEALGGNEIGALGTTDADAEADALAMLDGVAATGVAVAVAAVGVCAAAVPVGVAGDVVAAGPAHAVSTSATASSPEGVRNLTAVLLLIRRGG
jgi:hypothetical protein